MSEYSNDEIQKYRRENRSFSSYNIQLVSILKHEEELTNFLDKHNRKTELFVNGIIVLDGIKYKIRTKMFTSLTNAISSILTPDIQDFSIFKENDAFYISTIHGRGENAFKFYLK